MAAVCLSALVALGDVEYIHEDARIGGKEIHCFDDAGEQVSVVLGDFKITLGKRVISGRDGVIWISTSKVGKVVRHKMVVYVEGEAKVVEPNGAVSGDETMLVTVHHDGRTLAGGAVSTRPLKNFPLYKRALGVREQARKEAPAPTGRPTERTGPPLIVAGKGTRGKPPAPTTAPAGTPQVHPVNFHADSFSSDLRDGKRTTLARGNVYLSQGDPDSDAFLELRSQSAVIYSRRIGKDGAPPVKDTRSPLATKVRPGDREVIEGVYLTGDVVIARGERYLRGPEAYYDFTADRAIVPNVVFRTVQEQRNIPIYVRAEEARVLSAREIWFRNAKVSTSDFYTPSYHIGSSEGYLRDQVPYDEQTGERLGPPNWYADLRNATYNIQGVPILWSPKFVSDFEQGHTALRKASVGRDGDLGFGAETQWHLFRLLGMIKPEGFRSYLDIGLYEKGVMAGIDTRYHRETYSGYSLLYGVIDAEGEDDFGDKRKNVNAPNQRGRATFRHKHQLPDDWILQVELSAISDRNFMEEYFPEEFHAGKEQETLIYAKKQRDNWAVTGLLQGRINRFDTQTESYPDIGFYLLGQPLAEDRLSLYSESHVGVKRWRPANFTKIPDSDALLRLDTRAEVDAPLHLGPVNVVPYAVARATYWSDEPMMGESFRPYGQVGAKAALNIWRLYPDAKSRLFDVNGLKHIVTPEMIVFFSDAGGVEPSDLFPMDPGIETHLGGMHGVTFGARQRLQTKRGPNHEIVDWMRLDLFASFLDADYPSVPSDGRFFWARPEYSMARNHLYADFEWLISDTTTLLADANIDLDRGTVARSSIGLDVQRDPRLAYYVGLRTIDDVGTAVGTFSARYKINKKYTVAFAEQYDFDHGGGTNLVTMLSLTRKWPRWYTSFFIAFDQTDGDVSFFINFWPEGIEEVRLGTGKMSPLGSSSRN